MRKMFCRRTASPVAALALALLAVCAQHAYGYNRMGKDRILLMNDDTRTYRQVTGQAYTNTTLAAGLVLLLLRVHVIQVPTMFFTRNRGILLKLCGHLTAAAQERSIALRQTTIMFRFHQQR